MIKKFKDSDLVFEPSKLVFTENATAQISGKVDVSRVGANILLKLTDDYSKTSINQLVFSSNPLFNFMEEYVGSKIPCVADVKYVVNVVSDKKYQAIEIQNIHIDILSEEEKKALVEKKEEADKEFSTQVSTAVKSINDKFLKRLCINIYKNEKTLEKIRNNPATEHSAYNEKGGIMHMIADTVNLTVSTVDALNANFGEDSVKFNLDLMKTAALLCNVGRGYMLEFDEGNNIVKTEANIVDNDTLITRDLINLEIQNIAQMVNEDGSPKYEINQDIVNELIHMITASKSKLEYNPAIIPRTKHAMLLADVVSIVFTKGLFDKFEKENDGEKIVKAYDGGRNYVMY